MSLRSFLQVFGLLAAIVAVSVFLSPSQASASGDPPVAVNDVAVRGNQQCATVNVVANDTDAEGDTLTVTGYTSGTYAFVSTYSATTITACANAGLVGTDYVGYTITDGTAFASATIAVSNEAPVANDDVAARGSSQCATVNVLANDTDGDGDTLSVTGYTSGTYAYVSTYSATTITACANGGLVGTDYVSYTISDGYTTSSATIAVSNEAPVANDDVAVRGPSQCVVVDVLANDTDADGDVLSVTTYINGANAFVNTYTATTITACANAGLIGTDYISYTISDGYVTSSATIAVSNAAPVAVNDVAARGSDTCVVVDVIANDTDADGDALSVTTYVNGTYAYANTYSATTITACAALGLVGTDYITYTISDGYVTSTATIAVSNAAPVAVDDTDGAPKNSCFATNVLANDTDADGDPISIVNYTAGPNGYISTYSGNSITYCVFGGYTGLEAYTYEISDGYTTDTGTVTITVVNLPPFAVDDSVHTNVDEAINIFPLNNDDSQDGDALTLTAVGAPGFGTVTVFSEYYALYTPDPGFFGTDSFTYTVSDGTETDTGTVTVRVNRRPIDVDETVSTHANVARIITVLGNDSDADGDALHVDGPYSSSNGTAVRNVNNTITFTPASRFVGTATFFYYACDDVSCGDGATVTINVTNTLPVGNADSASTHANVPKQINVLTNDTDADGDALTMVSLSAASSGTVTNNGGGLVTYTPALNFVGSATFTYRADDGAERSLPTTVTINVTNAIPVAVNDSATTPRDAATTIAVRVNDTDADLDPLSIVSVTTPAHGAAAISAGSILYTPTAGYVGPDSFTYTITDGIAATCGTCTATVSITVTPRPPVVTAPGNQTAFEGTAKGFTLGSFTDPDTSPSWSVAVTWGDGSAVESLSIASVGSLGSRTHTYGADGIYTPTLTVTDADGGVSAPATFTVTVANVAPNLRAGTAQSVNAGVARSFYLGFLTDPGTDDTTWSLAITWGDGPAIQTITGAGTVSGSSHAYYATHTYATDGAKTVSVVATDPDGGVSPTRTFVITVNAAPVVTAPASQTASEGTAKAFPLGSFTDADGTGPWSVAVTWGDGTAVETFSIGAVGSLGTRTHTYGADASRTVSVTVTDAAGAVSAPATFPVTVANVVPNLRPGTAQSTNEGTSKSYFLGYFTDPGADDTSWTMTVTWGDGTPVETFTGAGTLSGSSHVLYRTHTYGGSETYTPTVRVVDGDGGASLTQSFTVTVANVAPLLRPGTAQSVNEGASKSFFLGYFTDPGTDDTTWTTTVNWGDGSAVETFTGAGVLSGASHVLYRTHVYGGSGSYTATVRVVDEDSGASVTQSFTATVANVAPLLRPGTAQTASVGVSKSFYLGYITDPGTDDTSWTVTVNWGDGTAVETFTGAGTLSGSARAFYRGHAYATTGPKTVTVTVVDEDSGSSGPKTFTITVS